MRFSPTNRINVRPRGKVVIGPSAEVGAFHPKAMPVILTEPDELETWMTAPWEVARELQRPLQDGALTVIERVKS